MRTIIVTREERQSMARRFAHHVKERLKFNIEVEEVDLVVGRILHPDADSSRLQVTAKTRGRFVRQIAETIQALNGADSTYLEANRLFAIMLGSNEHQLSQDLKSDGIALIVNDGYIWPFSVELEFSQLLLFEHARNIEHAVFGHGFSRPPFIEVQFTICPGIPHPIFEDYDVRSQAYLAKGGASSARIAGFLDAPLVGVGIQRLA